MRVDGVRIDARDGAFRRLRAAEIAAGRATGLTVTATGLEDVDAVAYARTAGVDLLLGYELGCPVPAAEFLDSLARRDAAPDRLAATANDPYPATDQLTEETHDVPR
jgi:EAL domain-containing protein (putative c-di-GMP-specific phosphodiesterase class I)